MGQKTSETAALYCEGGVKAKEAALGSKTWDLSMCDCVQVCVDMWCVTVCDHGTVHRLVGLCACMCLCVHVCTKVCVFW